MSAEELLETFVFGEHSSCTALRLARNLDIPVLEAASVLETFYKKHKGREGLWAVYTLSGVIGDGQDEEEVVSLVRSSDLETKKTSLKKVGEEKIFSIQVFEVENLHSLVLTDVEEPDRDLVNGDAQRAPISAEEKVQFFRSKLNAQDIKHMETIADQKTSRPMSTSQPVKQQATVKKTTTVKKEKPINLFQKVVKKEKTPQKVAPVADECVSPVKKAVSGDESNSPIFKRRGRKIVVGSDDDQTPEKKSRTRVSDQEEEEEEQKPDKKRKSARIESDEEEERPKKTRKNTRIESDEEEEKPKKTRKNTRIESDEEEEYTPMETEEKKDDSFDDEEMQEEEENPEKKTKAKSSRKKEEDKTQRKLDVERSQKSSQPANTSGKSKVWEQKQETFVDEDGFMVVKNVMIERELNPDEIEQKKVEEEEKKKKEPLKDVNPVRAGHTTDGKAKTGGPKKVQAPITSFFTRK